MGIYFSEIRIKIQTFSLEESIGLNALTKYFSEIMETVSTEVSIVRYVVMNSTISQLLMTCRHVSYVPIDLDQNSKLQDKHMHVN